MKKSNAELAEDYLVAMDFYISDRRPFKRSKYHSLSKRNYEHTSIIISMLSINVSRFYNTYGSLKNLKARGINKSAKAVLELILEGCIEVKEMKKIKEKKNFRKTGIIEEIIKQDFMDGSIERCEIERNDLFNIYVQEIEEYVEAYSSNKTDDIFRIIEGGQ